MGNKGGRHVVHHYVPSPVVAAQIAVEQQQCSVLKSEVDISEQKIQDLHANFEKVKQETEAIQAQLERSSDINVAAQRAFEEALVIARGMPRHTQVGPIMKIGVMGQTSVAKSTFCNSLVGQKVAPTGAGIVTISITHVGSRKCDRAELAVFDFPGHNPTLGSQYFSYTDRSVMEKIADLDIAVVLYADTVEYCVQHVQLAMALGVRCIVLARTKIDMVSDNDEKTWRNQMETDKSDIRRMVPEFTGEVFAISCRNAIKRALDPNSALEVYEWDDLVRHIEAYANKNCNAA